MRVLPLPGFEPMTIGALWRGEPSLLVQAAIDVVQGYAKETWPRWSCADEGR